MPSSRFYHAAGTLERHTALAVMQEVMGIYVVISVCAVTVLDRPGVLPVDFDPSEQKGGVATLQARGYSPEELVDSAESLALQARTVNLATSKLYTRAVLPPAILACSSSGTPSRISARILRDWGNVNSLCG